MNLPRSILNPTEAVIPLEISSSFVATFVSPYSSTIGSKNTTSGSKILPF
jgi:hypothetical protein